jgi:3-amino-5-hydroxybenzoate synthase
MLLAVLDSGHWWQSGGGKAEAFEHWLQSYQQVSGAVAVTNGTHALEVALRAISIGPGDDVLVPALTFISSASVVSAIGARPIPVDVLEDTLCIDVADAEQKRTPATRVIMPVHLAGQPADMGAVQAFAAKYDLDIVEDAAQAIGAEWRERRVGGFGQAGTFSFQAAKLLPAGEGGAVVTNSEEVLAKVRLLSNCGRSRGSKAYTHELLGSNYRMTEFQAALLLAQTGELDKLCAVRQTTAQLLSARLRDDGFLQPVSVASEVTRMVWYMYLMRPSAGSPGSSLTNAQLVLALTAEGIPSSPIYPPFYVTPAYSSELAEYRGSCPRAEKAAREDVWLHHNILLDGEEAVHDVCVAIRKIVANHEALIDSPAR